MNKETAKITETLANISMIMGDGYKFLKIRMVCEQWAKEADEGNLSSASLVDIINKFHKLINVIDKNK